MMKKNKGLRFALAGLLSIFTAAGLFTACVSDDAGTEEPVSLKKAELVTAADSMYWEIVREEPDGSKSKVCIFGTCHFGDERLYPLPDTVNYYLENADRVVSEISSDDMAAYSEIFEKAKENAVINDDSMNLIDNLTDTEFEYLLTNFSMEKFASYSYYEPWVLKEELNSLIYPMAGLSENYGHDNILYSMAKDKNIKIEGLDSAEEQLSILNYGSWQFQLKELKKTIAELSDVQLTSDLLRVNYEAYLFHDTMALLSLQESSYSSYLNGNTEEVGYYNTLLTDRNARWAIKISDYLDMGGTTFIFAGTSHFIGTDSVFDYLRSMNVL